MDNIFSPLYLCKFELDGYVWQSVEHYVQANKYYKPNDIKYMDYYHHIRLANSPIIANVLGNKKPCLSSKINYLIFKYKNLKKNQIIENILYKALFAKFYQNENLKKILLNTEPYQLYTTCSDYAKILVKIRQDIRLKNIYY